FGQVFPFDSTTYFEYNSLFATKTTVTCTNADCTSNVPGSPCVSTTFTNSAFDYMYVCSPTYDSLSSAMEFSACLASPSTTAPDPALGNASPTFATCSSSTVSGGADATTCIGASPVCSAVSAGYQALDFFGKNVLTLPIWSLNDYYARLSNWSQGGSTPGFNTAVGFGFYGLPNYFNWLNAYSATPAVPGTHREGTLTTVNSLNPFDASTYWDFHLLAKIYDSFIDLNATGAYQATSLASIAHINVLDEFTLDLNLKAKGPFTDYFIGSITMIPGHVWSACGASTWNTGVTGKNIAGTSIVNAA